MASGSIEKRLQKDGAARYRVVVWLPDSGAGKPERKTGMFRTKKEAEAARNQWQAEADGGTAIKNTSMTVAELCAAWLDVQRPALKPRTLVHYERTVNKQIVEHIGALPVQRVQPATVDTLYALLRSKGHSEDAVHRVHQRLMQVFTYAVKRRIVAVNPVLAVDAPTVRPDAPTVLTAVQIARFLTFAGNDGYSPLWLLLVQTGLRRGEALGLRWQDVDFERGKLSVNQTVECLVGTAHISTPKTAAARRTITLFPESLAALKAHRTRQLERRLLAAEWEDHGLVFASTTGQPLNPNNVLRNFYVIVKKANAKAEADGDRDAPLPAFTIHDLRHTHASHLLAAGWVITVVSRRLGHANPGITLTIYAHALTDVPEGNLATPAAFAFAGTA